MTAIFAYVQNDIAFIAADTCRTDKVVPFVAHKVHRWSEHILIAQTGPSRSLTRLIFEMMIVRDNGAELAKRDGLERVFSKFYKKCCVEAAGTLVVACAADGNSPAEIFTLDCGSGVRSSKGIAPAIYADGSDQKKFQEIADSQHLQVLQPGSPLALDVWASRCIHHANLAASAFVDWPADLAIARPCTPSSRRFIFKRIDSMLIVPTSDFSI